MTNAAEILEHSQSVLRDMLPDNIEVTICTSTSTIPVNCPAEAIENTLINIAYHALRLLDKGGHLILVGSIENLSEENDYHLPSGRYCKVICTELHSIPQRVSEREHALANESLTRSVSNLLSACDNRLRFAKLEGGNCVINLLFN